jgi:hypothetical protein
MERLVERRVSAQEREGFGVVLPANPDIEGIKAAARAEQALADMVESHPESDTRLTPAFSLTPAQVAGTTDRLLSKAATQAPEPPESDTLDAAWATVKALAYGQFITLHGQVHEGGGVPIRWHAIATGIEKIEVWADTEVGALRMLATRLTELGDGE